MSNKKSICQKAAGVFCGNIPTTDESPSTSDGEFNVSEIGASSPAPGIPPIPLAINVDRSSPSSPKTPSELKSSSPVARLKSCFKRSSSASPKNLICASCNNPIIPGQQAMFTSECLHNFHFRCVTSNVNYGNRVCPACQTKWNEIPYQIAPESVQEKSVFNLQPAEPDVYDDDDPILPQPDLPENVFNRPWVNITTFLEYAYVPSSAEMKDFQILVNLKVPSVEVQDVRAPIDLVVILDVSNSMAGDKIALVKQAMRVIIPKLGQHDRLSIVTFSSVAHRLFRLSRMTYAGINLANQTVDSLTSGGGTNIADGLKKGLKVILERKYNNASSVIILFSDGVITDSDSILPSSMQSRLQIRVHTFAFGENHDSGCLQTISNDSGGTYSYIDSEEKIMDAYLGCMKGLLCVVVKDVWVTVDCEQPHQKLIRINAGECPVELKKSNTQGVIAVGDLYAAEEREILVVIEIPMSSEEQMDIMSVNCTFRDPVNSYPVRVGEVRVKLDRPDDFTGRRGAPLRTIEVDRFRNRLIVKKVMEAARKLVEDGHFEVAGFSLTNCRKELSVSTSVIATDSISMGLLEEVRQMERFVLGLQADKEGLSTMDIASSSHQDEASTSGTK